MPGGEDTHKAWGSSQTQTWMHEATELTTMLSHQMIKLLELIEFQHCVQYCETYLSLGEGNFL